MSEPAQSGRCGRAGGFRPRRWAVVLAAWALAAAVAGCHDDPADSPDTDSEPMAPDRPRPASQPQASELTAVAARDALVELVKTWDVSPARDSLLKELTRQATPDTDNEGRIDIWPGLIDIRENSWLLILESTEQAYRERHGAFRPTPEGRWQAVETGSAQD